MKTQTEHEERMEQAKEMQRIALQTKTFTFSDMARPVGIGDIVDELNNRVASYLRFSRWEVVRAQKQALRDFNRYTHAAIETITDASRDGTEFFRYIV